MARIRSPGYPSFSLEQAVEHARKIHEADRQHPVAREVAAQHMGFTGLSGTSDRALSALMHYGLAEKVTKGEIRVTELALRIVHADTLEEMRSALHEAAFRPDLFKELRSRYPEAPPSVGSLSSYLSRENFAPVAIGPAAKAYLETCHYLQRERAYESDGGAPEDTPESPLEERNATMVTAPLPTPVELLPATANSELNRIAMNIDGDKVQISGLFDLKGLRLLRKKIAGLEAIMSLDEEDDLGTLSMVEDPIAKVVG